MQVVVSVCSALSYLHNEKKLLHGDIKSSNVLIKGEFDEVSFIWSYPLMTSISSKAADKAF